MNVDTGQIKALAELTAKEKESGDWEELPDDIDVAQIAELQKPMNRHERRKLIAEARRLSKKGNK